MYSLGDILVYKSPDGLEIACLIVGRLDRDWKNVYKAFVLHSDYDRWKSGTFRELDPFAFVTLRWVLIQDVNFL